MPPGGGERVKQLQADLRPSFHSDPGTIEGDESLGRRRRPTYFSEDQHWSVGVAIKAEVAPAIAAGWIRPVVDRVIPFADAPKAAELMRARAVTGKIVLDLVGVE